MAGEEKGMESRVTGKWDVRATRSKRGSIELNWDCLSNFEEKSTPLFSPLGWHPANVICFESVCVLLYAWPGLPSPPSSYKAPSMLFSHKKTCSDVNCKITANSSNPMIISSIPYIDLPHFVWSLP